MDGYCRMFDGRGEGHVKLGFFREGVPSGKFQSFTTDGASIEEGIKEGDDLLKEIDIANYLTKFLKNDRHSLQVLEKSASPVRKTSVKA
mmetsp:Transcript_5480/g.9289  ORF Transcript_5480/g.9289 Transcript_5480/m.9289 type:complete len:89 (+) Transcript_5480:586-852(+)